MIYLKKGSLLQGGRYRIDEVLGRGGFGITYLGFQMGLNRKVAIKEFFMTEYCERDGETSHISLGTSGSRAMVERFRQKFVKEAQTISQLNHPHIIRIHDVFEENGTAYYVMEYHGNGSLSDLVKQRGGLGETASIGYIRQIGEALRYIHKRKINHLDVKPANVLLDDDCHAVLIDFGMSKRYDAVGDQTSTTPVGISHGYAPLEQYKQDGVGTFSPATDIYSLGATFYKLLTGATPPDASDLDESVLSSGLSVVSAPVRETILQSMQLKRKDRPQSMDAFLSLLEPSSATADDVDDEEITMIDIPEPSTPSSPTSQAPEPPTVPDERPSRKWLLPLVFVLVVALGIFGLTQIPGFGGDDDESLSPDTLVHLETVAVPLPVANDSMRKHEMTKPDKVAEVSNPVVEAAPTTTSLYVSTSPSGATVYLDGKEIGKSPIEDKEFSRGKHTVKIVLEGYETFTKKYTFGDEPIVINEALTAVALATVSVDTPKKEGTPQIESDSVKVPVTTIVATTEHTPKKQDSQVSEPVKAATTGIINGHKWVDLGLSVKWATMNVGASTPGDCGDYFAWGEVQSKSKYTKKTSLTYNKEMNDISGNSQYDAARYHWGGSWRLPTKKEWEELEDKCRWTWSKENGHNGYKVVGPNGNSIFLPAAGYRYGTSTYSVGTDGYYWSGSPYESDTQLAYYLDFDDGYRYVHWIIRYYGRSVRPVSE